MNHVTSQLAAWIAGELDASRARAVAEHIAGCAACREAEERERALWNLLGAAEGEPAASGVWPAVRSRTTAASDGRGWFFGAGPASRAGWAAVAVAAGVVLSVLVPGPGGRLAGDAAAGDDTVAGIWLEGTGYDTDTAGNDLADIWLDAAGDTGQTREADDS